MSSLNPWERLAARLPSCFIGDPFFCKKKPKEPKHGPALDLGPMSEKGSRDYLLRQAARRRQEVA